MPATSTTAPAFTGEGGAAFCAEIGTLNDRFARLLASEGPQAAREIFTSAEQAVSALSSSGPAEIRGALAVVVRSYRRLLDSLKKVDYDLSRLPQDVSRTLSSDEVRRASDRLSAYQRTVCGQPW